MSSALAQQLRQLQQADQVLRGVSAPAGKRASFLFDPKEAADFDAEAIYELGMSGLQELQDMDPNFLRFQPILFSSNALDMDRTLLTKKENEEIDEHIRTFLRFLSPFILMKPAHKVLEWLVRKYSVNEMNVDAVVECFLPYHETSIFVRMVQILYFKDDDKWGFLFDVKKNAKMINRTFLALRCKADRSLLNFVYESVQWHAKHLSEMKKRNVHIVPFFTYLCMEYMSSIDRVELVHVTHLLQMITGLLESQHAPDLQLSGFMLFSLLAEKFSFSEKAINKIVLLATTKAADTCLNELLMFLSDLIIRGHIKSLPAEALSALASRSNIVPGIKKVSGMYDVSRFLQLVLAHIISLGELEEHRVLKEALEICVKAAK